MAKTDVTRTAPSRQVQWRTVIAAVAGLACATIQPAHAGNIPPLFRLQAGFGVECEAYTPPYERISVAVHPREMRVLFRQNGVVSSAPVTQALLSGLLPNEFGRYDVNSTAREVLSVWFNGGESYQRPRTGGYVDRHQMIINGSGDSFRPYKCINTGEDIEEAPSPAPLEPCDPPKIRTLVGCEALPANRGDPPSTASGKAASTLTLPEQMRAWCGVLRSRKDASAKDLAECAR
jgi:hypothetical protein